MEVSVKRESTVFLTQVFLQLCIHQKQQKESTRYTGKGSRLPKIIYHL